MKKNFYLLLLVLTLVGATLACGLVSGSENADEPVNQPAQLDDASAVSDAPYESGAILFSDDFSNPFSGWDTVSVETGVTDYADGVYRIFVNKDNTDIWANPGQFFTDTIIEVEATKVGGPDDNDFGVICRYQDLQNFYFLIISSDGYGGIGIVQDGDQRIISDEAELLPNDAIRQGNVTSFIRAECVGNRLSLYADGTLIASVQDDTFASGDVGLLAGTYDEPGTDIHFDNFVVTAP